jgi:hypothetical protein
MSPSQPESPLTGHELRLLAEVVLLAGAQGDLVNARKIHAALEACRPAATFPHALLAMALLNRCQRDEAVRLLDSGLRIADEAGAPDLHALRAFALHLAGRRAESERAAKAAGDHELARALLATV